MGAVAPLRLIQLGEESTRGTEVAATARLIPRPGAVTWRDRTEKPPVEADWGLLDKRHSSEPARIARQLTEMEITQDLDFEQVLYPFHAGLRGAVSPGAEQTVSQGDFLWTFTPQATADPAPDAFTLEYVEREGTTVRQQLTAVYGLCRRIRLSGGMGAEYATLESEWFARKSVAQAATSDPGIPTRTVVPAPLFTIGTGANFAALSSPTLFQAQVVSWEWELITGIAPKFRADDDSPDFAAYQFGVRECTLRMTLDLTAEAETERASRLQAAAVQYFRVSAEGSQIGTGLNHRVSLDGCYELTSPVESGNDEDGQSTLDLEYTAVHDATKGAALEVQVVNTLSALP